MIILRMSVGFELIEEIIIVVQRLSDELARYQVKYPPLLLSENEVAATVGSMVAPWFFNSQHMSPLLVSYDHRIMELSNEIKVYKEKIESMTVEVRAVSSENEELQESLKNMIEKHLSKGSDSPSVPFSIPTEEWDEVQQRLELLDKENRLLLEEQRELQTEIDRLRNENRKSHNEFSLNPNDNDRMKIMLESAKKKIEALTREKDDYKRDIKRVKQLENEIAGLERTVATSNHRCKVLDDELEKHKALLDDLQHERKRFFQNEKTINFKDIEMNGM